jgi:putative membrane protein
MTTADTTLRSTDQRPALIPFAAGLAILALLWMGPLAPMSRTSFAAHMLLHIGVVAVAAPFLGYALAQRLPAPDRFAIALSWCLTAGLFEMVVVWGWHVPLFHDAAGRSTPLFVVEQASFLAGGLALWTAAMAARTRRTAGAAAIVLFLTFTHMSMFGLVLTLAPRLLYDPNLCQAAFGLDRLDGQHLGGVIMIAGGLPFFLGTGLALRRLIGGQ